jgi:hypothetical protein
LLRKTPGNGNSRHPVGLKQRHPCRFFAFRSLRSAQTPRIGYSRHPVGHPCGFWTWGFCFAKPQEMETAGLRAGLKQRPPAVFRLSGFGAPRRNPGNSLVAPAWPGGCSGLCLYKTFVHNGMHGKNCLR